MWVTKAATNKKEDWSYVAAFLANSKTLAVYNSVCDEQNVDGFNGKFPLSNACGMNGLSYQNFRCSPDESHMECPPDPGLQMTAVASLTSSDSLSKPPEFFCGPRRYFPFTGYYDEELNTIMNDAPFANQGKPVFDLSIYIACCVPQISDSRFTFGHSWEDRCRGLLLVGPWSGTDERCLHVRKAQLPSWSKSKRNRPP